MKIRSFLDSANKALEYRIVAAPYDLKSCIASHIRIEPADGPVIYRQDITIPEGKISLFFREKVALGFKDKQGRDIYRTDGICVSGEGAEKFVFHPHYLDEAERINDDHFRNFWEWTDPQHPAIDVSETIPLKPELAQEANNINILVRPPVGACKTDSKTTAASLPATHRADSKAHESNTVEKRAAISSAAIPEKLNISKSKIAAEHGTEKLKLLKGLMLALGILGIFLLGMQLCNSGISK